MHHVASRAPRPARSARRARGRRSRRRSRRATDAHDLALRGQLGAGDVALGVPQLGADHRLRAVGVGLLDRDQDADPRDPALDRAGLEQVAVVGDDRAAVDAERVADAGDQEQQRDPIVGEQVGEACRPAGCPGGRGSAASARRARGRSRPGRPRGETSRPPSGRAVATQTNGEASMNRRVTSLTRSASLATTLAAGSPPMISRSRASSVIRLTTVLDIAIPTIPGRRIDIRRVRRWAGNAGPRLRYEHEPEHRDPRPRAVAAVRGRRHLAPGAVRAAARPHRRRRPRAGAAARPRLAQPRRAGGAAAGLRGRRRASAPGAAAGALGAAPAARRRRPEPVGAVRRAFRRRALARRTPRGVARDLVEALGARRRPARSRSTRTRPTRSCASSRRSGRSSPSG